MTRITMSLAALPALHLASSSALAHPGHSHHQQQAAPANNEQVRNAAEDQAALEFLAVNELPLLRAQLDQQPPRANGDKAPDIAKAFEAFVKLKAIKTRWDERFFYLESNGVPAHQMMVGITAWQQQVPIPQKYVGENSWQIPLHPVPAKNPQSAKGHFLRGAIAIAANGVPIFNPLNNRGDDAYLFGELDEFGGHCGRADDYHYHIAPVHLEKTIGKGLPIAYALDGYPIYGYEEPDGSKVVGLDAFNGHKDKDGNYHYHATKKYPYLNGGFHGEVTERGGQVDPQPRAEPLRPDLRPLRDAKITDFKETKPGSYLLTYDVRGKKGSVSYTLAGDGSAKFTFVDTNGSTTNETYSPRRRGPGGGGDDRRHGLCDRHRTRTRLSSRGAMKATLALNPFAGGDSSKCRPFLGHDFRLADKPLGGHLRGTRKDGRQDSTSRSTLDAGSAGGFGVCHVGRAGLRGAGRCAARNRRGGD